MPASKLFQSTRFFKNLLVSGSGFSSPAASEPSFQVCSLRGEGTGSLGPSPAAVAAEAERSCSPRTSASRGEEGAVCLWEAVPRCVAVETQICLIYGRAC